MDVELNEQNPCLKSFCFVATYFRHIPQDSFFFCLLILMPKDNSSVYLKWLIQQIKVNQYAGELDWLVQSNVLWPQEQNNNFI